MCSEDGIKFANQTNYSPTRIHYDGQPERVQIMFTTDSGPIRLFAVPGSGTDEAQALISEILGIQMLDGFSTHRAALDAHPEVRDLMHEFGVAVPGNGLLLWKTRVWHFEAETEQPAVNDLGLAKPKQPFDWTRSKAETKKSDVFRIYCGVVTIESDRRDDLIRHAFYREHNWAMEAFAHCNRATPVFVAEKSSQATDRETYSELEEEWKILKATPFEQMKAFLRELPMKHLMLHGLTSDDV